MPGSYFTLDSFDLTGKTVLVRVDVNSPIDPIEGRILGDNRIRQHAGTIQRLSDSKVIILAHQSRPGKADFTELDVHARRLSRIMRKPVSFVDDLFGSKARAAIGEMKPGDILMLQNVRFYSEEVAFKDDNMDKKKNSHIVSNLAPLADYFVLDAFAAAHRAQPSLVGFTELMPSMAGEVMRKEIEALQYAVTDARRPSMAILGGLKVDDSIEIMQNLLSQDIVDRVLTTGVVGQIFLLAQGHDLGEPNITFLDTEVKGYQLSLEIAQRMLDEFGDRIEIPVDLALNDNGSRVKLRVEELPAKFPIFDIGIDTIVKYIHLIHEARTVILNGPSGVFEQPTFATGTKEIFRAIAESDCFSIMGGGETTTVLDQLGIKGDISHVSTGGGACLTFLAGKNMPGIQALERSYELFSSEG